MRHQKFTANQTIIKYGDVGTEYFILSRGKVRVIVYKPETNPNDTDL